VGGGVRARWHAVGAQNEMSGVDQVAGRARDKIHLTYDGRKLAVVV
jgi:hypothetical protein